MSDLKQQLTAQIEEYLNENIKIVKVERKIDDDIFIPTLHFDISCKLNIEILQDLTVISANGKEIVGKTILAVSYTHLTLPTICSV